MIGYTDINRQKNISPDTTHVGWAEPEMLIPGLLARVEELEEEVLALTGFSRFLVDRLSEAAMLLGFEPEIISMGEEKSIDSLHEELLQSAL